MAAPWLTNPLTNQMLEPFIILLLMMFSGAALALLTVQGLRGVLLSGNTPAKTTSTPQKVLWQRYRTWAIIAFLFSGAAFGGPLTIAVLCAFLCWQGGREYAILTSMPTWHRTVLVFGGWGTFVAVLLLGSSVLAIAPILAFFVWSILSLQPTEEGDAEIARRFTLSASGLWGYLYLGWLPAYLLILSMDKMPGLVLVIGLGVALSDVGAFCVGKALAGPKLAPHLSPSKTWSGVLGNILGAALALLLTAFAVSGIQLWQWGLFALAIGLGSIWGDLLESLLKRQHGVKDAGEMLPGFGGLLDRIDSLLLVAPLVYYLSHFLFG
jgi:phosphatidate cytidylyltransferase